MTYFDLILQNLPNYMGYVICFAVITLIIVSIFYFCKHKFYATEIEFHLSLVGLARVKIRPTNETTQIAHKVWVELVTRKISIPFDDEHDVITEIYDSWFQMFTETRKLIGAIPANHIKRSRDVRNLVDILTKLLNEGMRPHLTKWQARLRHWQKNNAEKNPNMTPQELQRTFPDYDELVADLKDKNCLLVDFSRQLHDFLS